MTDKTKIANTVTKNSKPKLRPSTVSTATTSRTRIAPKEKASATRPKKQDHDVTIMKTEKERLPDFDEEYQQVAYGRFMRAMLEECLVEEKIEREETQVDVQMAQLAERFKKTMDQLDKTNRRLKDISFVVEQKRLLDLKNTDCDQYYQMTDNSNASPLLQDLLSTERSQLDKIELHNVDFGYDKLSGHKQLLDAVNDAIEGLDKIKKESKLDLSKFSEYDHSKDNITAINNDRFYLESLKSDFELKFPNLSEQLLQEASERIAKVIDNNEDVDEGSDDD